MNLRDAVTDDALQILEIYAPIVEQTAISFELTLPSPDDMKQRIESSLRSHAYLVAEIDGKVAGYAYGRPHRPREAYQYSAETSVYVHTDFKEQGVGKTLYVELIGQLGAKGFHNAFAGIALPNDASEALHKSVGFEQIGVFKEVGFKNDTWHDVAWWQRSLANNPK